MFDRLFRGLRSLTTRAPQAAARKAELAGELERAALLYAEAEQPEEAARVMIVRGDAEMDAKKRLVFYTQAASYAPADHAVTQLARKKRAELVIVLASEGGTSPSARRDLVEAAKELEALGDQDGAAKAYERAGDAEGEARALAQAGDVEKLELLLTEQGAREREQRRKQGVHRELEMLVSSGRRREALALAEAQMREHAEPSAIASLRERAEHLRARRVTGPIAKVIVHGTAFALVLGDEIVVGRTEGALQIASAAVSRRHLSITRSRAADARGASGAAVVRDLGSRNGTLLRGLALAGETLVGEGLELKVGKEVPLRVAPSTELEDAIAVDVGGTRYVAPLGPLSLPIAGWRLESGSDGWVELVTIEPAFAGDVEIVRRTTLLVGDAFSTTRKGEPVLRVIA